MNRLIRSLLHIAGVGLIASPLVVIAADPTTRPFAEPATQPAAEPATRPTTGPATQPATHPAAEAPKPAPKINDAFLQGQRNQRDSQRTNNAGYRVAGELALNDLLQFSLDRGVLRVDIQAPPAANEVVRYKVKGSDAIWTTSRSSFVQQQWVGNGWVRTMTDNFNLDRTEPNSKNDADIWSIHVSTNKHNLSIRGQSVLGYIYFSQSYSVPMPVGAGAINGGTQVNLSVQEWAAMNNGNGIRMNMAFNGHARTLNELRTKSPEGFRKYLVPLLSKLSDLSFLTPGATDVYAVFSEIPADPQASQMVDALLPNLDSDAFTIREAASKQLLELGPPAVLAVLRKDLSNLSDEQRSQIGRLISTHRRRGDLTVSEARTDTSFLSDCLEYSDINVRKAAKASLEKVLGETLNFDPAQPAEKLGVAADAVRKRVTEAQTAAAATQPAAEDANKPAAGPIRKLGVQIR